uniref:Uncharacterized protein n=1 Tax=Guillardia theta TaxID=55529 RepID=A0A7S4UKT0_GUITH|mmetsp:Transcript_45316/g.142602  ORF Transcript_45316/g.142602 Transcript_45316/m.142602 type:complete len:288 (+) Transcript_45316:21-884(+)
MCIMAALVGMSAEFPFILVHNRDEDWTRKTFDVQDNGAVIAAIDSRAGGTWMGLHKETARFAALTNVRTKQKVPTPSKSRGRMVQDYLERGSEQWEDYYAYHTLHCSDIRARQHGEPEVYLRTCVPTVGGGECTWETVCERLDSGHVYCISNEECRSVNTANFPKCAWLKQELERTIKSFNVESKGKEGALKLAEAMSIAMSSTVNFAEESLPDMSFSPLTKEQETILQRGPYIHGPSAGFESYGTQTQTIVISSASSKSIYYFCRRTEGLDAEQARQTPFACFEVQ